MIGDGIEMNESKYDLKQKDAVIQYFAEEGYALEAFTVEDISSGNMNYVYRVKEWETGKTYILKYAAEHTRISEEILVSLDRINIEASVLMKYSQYVPQYVPRVYRYDELNHCILMEDYSDYSILRERLNQYESIPYFAENITSYLVNGIIPTLNIGVNSESEGSKLQNMYNPLCETTITYVFTEPFIRTGSSNDIFEPSKGFIDVEVYQDQKLLYQIEELKRKFIEKKQSLIHGDLHTGSIFVKQSSLIVFDFEFSFYGPIGFDIGNLLANLIFSWLHARAMGQNEKFMHWVESVIEKIIDNFKNKFACELYTRLNNKALYSLEFVQTYTTDIIHDAAAFAGVELLRRIIGIAHVSDITSISNFDKREEAERFAVKLAKKLIMNSEQFDDGRDFIKDMFI
jgi:5-methylthioribose kinase